MGLSCKNYWQGDFPKNKDTALNAFQIESQINKTQSKDLADSLLIKQPKKLLI